MTGVPASAEPGAPSVDVVRVAPASVGQRLLWVFDRYRGARGALNVPVLVRVSGSLDEAHLAEALGGLVERHESLRTTFCRQGAKLVQVVHRARPVAVRVEEVVPGPGRHRRLDEAIGATICRHLDAADWPLSASVWSLGAEEWILALNVHHLTTDEASSGIIMRDLGAFYRRDPGRLPEIGWQYADFARWQQEQLEHPSYGDHVGYWVERLRGARSPVLPTRAAPPPEGARAAGKYQEPVAQATIDRLQNLSRAERTTLFSVVLACFYAALATATGQYDLAVTSLFSERSRPELRHTVGYFMTPLVLRSAFFPETTLRALVRQCRRSLFEAMEHQIVPFHLLPPRSVDGGSLRPDDVVLQVMPEPAGTTDWCQVLHRPDTERAARTFGLEVVVRPWYRQWSVTGFYAEEVFEAGFVESLVRHLVAVLAAAAGDPDTPVGALAPFPARPPGPGPETGRLRPSPCDDQPPTGPE